MARKCVSPNSPCYLYLIGQGDNGKIGISSCPDERARQIKYHSPAGPAKIVTTYLFHRRRDAIDIEARIHAQFNNQCIGGEWFRGIKLDDFRVKVIDACKLYGVECSEVESPEAVVNIMINRDPVEIAKTLIENGLVDLSIERIKKQICCGQALASEVRAVLKEWADTGDDSVFDRIQRMPTKPKLEELNVRITELESENRYLWGLLKIMIGRAEAR